MTTGQEYLIALGGNLPSRIGPPYATLRAAIDLIGASGGDILQVSRFYSTPCFPKGAGPDYVNAAVRIACKSDPGALLAKLHVIEADMGRERVQRWGRRTLDLDLLAAGDLVLPDAATHAAWRDLPPDQQANVSPDSLILPHPRLQDRAFVLVPLADVAPDWVHPVLGLTVAQMLDRLPPADLAEVLPL